MRVAVWGRWNGSEAQYPGLTSYAVAEGRSPCSRQAPGKAAPGFQLNYMRFHMAVNFTSASTRTWHPATTTNGRAAGGEW